MKRRRTANKTSTLPDRFVPKFLDEADGRQASIRLIRQKLNQLMGDVDADSVQKEMLCEQAVFLYVKLQTMQVEALETGELDFGSYTQAVNALSGLLTKLGLEKKAKQTLDLKGYVKERKK